MGSSTELKLNEMYLALHIPSVIEIYISIDLASTFYGTSVFFLFATLATEVRHKQDA